MGKGKNKKVIKKPHLLLCEGEDTVQFMIQYLEYLQKNEKDFEDFVAFDFGGNEELPTFLSDIRYYPGYEMVASMTIIRDSEKDHGRAIREVKSVLAKLGFPVPPGPNAIVHGDKPESIVQNVDIKVAFSLFPSLSKNNRNGTLEDLFIENLKEDGIEHILNDINSFLEHLRSKGRKFTWLHKTKLHTYFSVTDDFVAAKIGEAAEWGAFDFECAEMNQLKELLRNIAAE